jgi:DNA-binding transcriptional regulator YiaG
MRRPVRTLEELEAHVEREAKEEGPAALADLQAQRERFRLAREITLLRKKQKLTQVELSKRSGVPQSEISKIESGAANASEVTLLRLLQPLGRTLGVIPARHRVTRRSA